MYMYPIERQKAILEILERRNAASVKEIAKELYIGEATIRRDLEEMGKNGLLIRTHGGAVALSTENNEQPILFREAENKLEKERIAFLASELVMCGKTLFLDSSTTALRIIPHIERKQLTVITHGIKTALELNKHGIKTVCTGGALIGSTSSLVGSETVRSVERYHADIFFLSCRGISLSSGYSEGTEEVCAVKEAMARNSDKIIMLADSTKFNKTAFARLSMPKKVDYIITNYTFNKEWEDYFKERETKIIMAD